MERYYYTDPLAAAWMAKNFGMNFWDADTGITVSRYDGGLYDECLFNIHPDSLHLLEPQEDDLGIGVDDGAGRIYVVFNRGRWEWVNSTTYQSAPKQFKLERIIQRDGKPFHWPKSEAA